MQRYGGTTVQPYNRTVRTTVRFVWQYGSYDSTVCTTVWWLNCTRNLDYVSKLLKQEKRHINTFISKKIFHFGQRWVCVCEFWQIAHPKTHTCACVCDWNFGKMHTCVRCACGRKSSVRMCVRARPKIVATHSLKKTDIFGASQQTFPNFLLCRGFSSMYLK